MITGYELIERMYSDYDEYEDTKLYSTGDSELDELLERAFCDGYEYAQYEFSDDDDKKSKKKKYKNDSHRGYGRAYFLGGLGGVAGRAVGKRRVEKYLDDGYSLEEAKRMAERDGAIVGTSAAIPSAVYGAKQLGDTFGKTSGALVGGAIGAASGALGGYLGTKRVNQEWKRKGHDDDDD